MIPAKRIDTPKTYVLDIRPVLAAGEEPFPHVMSAIAAVGVGETLELTSPFLPSPLIEKLQSEGFRIHPERRRDGSWVTSFRRS